jgi:hypothetical protein
MNGAADMNSYHSINSALTKISVNLQLLNQRTPLSEQQRQFVNAALQGVADLDKLLRDDTYRRLTDQPTVPSSN